MWQRFCRVRGRIRSAVAQPSVLALGPDRYPDPRRGNGLGGAYLDALLMAPASKPTRSGAEHSDAFHRLIDTWPLPTTVNRPLIRLYFEEGRIVALVGQGSRDGIQLWTFDTTGRLLSEENLLGFSPASDFALAYARTTSGRRLFALGNGGHYEAEGRTDDWDFVLVAQEPDGQLLLREHALSTEGFPAPAAETQR